MLQASLRESAGTNGDIERAADQSSIELKRLNDYSLPQLQNLTQNSNSLDTALQSQNFLLPDLSQEMMQLELEIQQLNSQIKVGNSAI